MWRWRKIIYGFLIVLAVWNLILWVKINYQSSQENLRVIFLDVGQGDAILIEQGENQFLIDGGRSEKKLLEKLGQFMPFWDRQIEVVEITHPDSDHITGLIGALKNYQVNFILKTQVESSTQTYQSLKEVIDREIAQGGQVVEGLYGVRLRFPNGAQAEIYYPFAETDKEVRDKNATSIVTKITYGQNSFLLMGDLPIAEERELIGFNLPLQSNVLKLGHHGSRYSSSPEFLRYVHPQTAIISVGKNRYGHPHQEVIRRLSREKINFWRTDRRGDIEYLCNPQSCQVIFHPTN